MSKPNMPNPDHELRNKDVGYERRDMTTRSVVAFLVGLGLFVLIVHFIVTGLFDFADRYYVAHEKPAPMARTSPDPHLVTPSDINRFPEPRLETDERTEIFPFRAAEEEHLHSYGWVDQKSGTMYMPIDRAMQMVAQRGLNTTPRTGEVPTSIVNMVKAAAERSDQSGGSTGLEKTGVQVQAPGKQ